MLFACIGDYLYGLASLKDLVYNFCFVCLHMFCILNVCILAGIVSYQE